MDHSQYLTVRLRQLHLSSAANAVRCHAAFAVRAGPRASRTESNAECWYRIAGRRSVWPITFITIARFPVAPYAAVPAIPDVCAQ